MSWVSARRWFDDVWDIKGLSASMAETHELVVARVKDNDSPIDSYSLCPCLQQKINTSALLYSNWYYKLHLTCRSIF